jgi:hypothetical protein
LKTLFGMTAEKHGGRHQYESSSRQSLKFPNLSQGKDASRPAHDSSMALFFLRRKTFVPSNPRGEE